MTESNREPFGETHIAINRVYTRKGDGGQTSLVGGQKVAKDDLRIEVYGTVDELNAIVGASRHSALGAAESPNNDAQALHRLASTLLRIQHELFNLGSILATLPEDVHPKQPRVTDAEIDLLEREMDAMNEHLAPLRSFVLPGGSRLNTDLHLARTVCRRAERLLVGFARDHEVDATAVRYLNRLSDAFFVMSRAGSQYERAAEVLWQPNASASGLGG